MYLKFLTTTSLTFSPFCYFWPFPPKSYKRSIEWKQPTIKRMCNLSEKWHIYSYRAIKNVQSFPQITLHVSCLPKTRNDQNLICQITIFNISSNNNTYKKVCLKNSFLWWQPWLHKVLNNQFFFFKVKEKQMIPT